MTTNRLAILAEFSRILEALPGITIGDVDAYLSAHDVSLHDLVQEVLAGRVTADDVRCGR